MTADRRVMVTGGAGFIGSHLVDALVQQEFEVHVIDNLATGKRERLGDDIQFHEADVADSAALIAIAQQHGPFSQWFHLAAQADVRVSVDDPMFDARTNVLGTIAVLEAARIDSANVVLASTGGAIYGDAQPPTPESARECPESPYGAAKLAAEKYVEMHARLWGLSHAIVRFANVYGPRQDPHGEAGVVAIFAGKVLHAEPARIFGDGEQTRDYVYVGDVVQATLEAARVSTDQPGNEVPVFNVGTGRETSVLELWNAMQHTAGADLGVTFEPARPGELSRSALDAQLARRVLGIAIDTPLDQGLTATLEWMRTHA